MRLGTAEDPMAQAGRSNRREILLTCLGNPTADLRPPRWFPRLGTHAELTLAAAATHGWGGLLWCPWDRVADMFCTEYCVCIEFPARQYTVHITYRIHIHTLRDKPRFPLYLPAAEFLFGFEAVGWPKRVSPLDLLVKSHRGWSASATPQTSSGVGGDQRCGQLPRPNSPHLH